MAKSLRSKRKRKLRRERRVKLKVKEDERLLETLGITVPGKDAEMAVNNEEKEQRVQDDGKQDEHVEKLPKTNEDIEMDQEIKQQKSGTSKIRINRQQLLKRLGKKKHIKKKNKLCKW